MARRVNYGYEKFQKEAKRKKKKAEKLERKRLKKQGDVPADGQDSAATDPEAPVTDPNQTTPE